MSNGDVPALRALMVAASAGLNDCDGYVVLVTDPETGEADAHGPHDGLGATLHAERLRREFDHANLADVLVHVVRLHHPAPTTTPENARSPSRRPPTRGAAGR